MTAASIAAFGRLKPLFDEAGAHWLDLPVLHPADPFLETAGEDIRRRIFMTEGAGGERLCLRPDFTIPVCLHHIETGAPPRRYAYEGVVFRRDAEHLVERPEAGLEDVGREDRAGADAEALALAVEGVRRLDGDSFSVRLGDIGLFTALLAALGLAEAWRTRLRRSFGVPHLMEANLARLSGPREGGRGPSDPELAAVAGRRDRASLVALVAKRLYRHGHGQGAGRSAEEIADRYLANSALAEPRIEEGALDTLRDYLGLAAPLERAAERLERFATRAGIALGDALPAFAARAEAIGTGRDVRFEAGFGRPFDYYSGLVFEIASAEGARPLSGGGRYDRLFQMLGADAAVPAVGFSIRLDRLGGEK